MALQWESVVIDAVDPIGLGRWWAEALGWLIIDDSFQDFEIIPPSKRWPGILFEPVTKRQKTKNRLHLDLRPDDQVQEVERLLGLGARRIDIGQQDVSWVVMADPEGNEFCVLADV